MPYIGSDVLPSPLINTKLFEDYDGSQDLVEIMLLRIRNTTHHSIYLPFGKKKKLDQTVYGGGPYSNPFRMIGAIHFARLNL